MEGDAEALPFPDGSFDIVLSAIGVMFSPDQETAAAELLRVCRPGGTIGVLSWTASGFLGQLFKPTAGYVPPPRELKPPALWGTEERVRELLGAGSSSISFTRGSLAHRFRSPQHYADFFLTYTARRSGRTSPSTRSGGRPSGTTSRRWSNGSTGRGRAPPCGTRST